MLRAIERFTEELDVVLSDIAFSGLQSVQPAVLEKLRLLEGVAQELGMEKAASLLALFAAALRDYRLGSAAGEQAAGLLCALDFYNKTAVGNMDKVSLEEISPRSYT